MGQVERREGNAKVVNPEPKKRTDRETMQARRRDNGYEVDDKTTSTYG